MSRHTFKTTHNDRPVEVCAGWDRPLQGFFMTVLYTDTDAETDYEYAFNNLELTLPHPACFDFFRDALHDLGIAPPEAMVDEIEADGAANMGNKVMDWTPEPVISISVQVKTDIAKQRIDDMLCNAFEGGSTYWCNKIVVENGDYCGGEWGHEVLTRGGNLIVHVQDDENAIVKGSDLVAGLEIMADKYPRHWADFIAENDDADTADCFFQVLCFGEIVYG